MLHFEFLHAIRCMADASHASLHYDSINVNHKVLFLVYFHAMNQQHKKKKRNRVVKCMSALNADILDNAAAQHNNMYA